MTARRLLVRTSAGESEVSIEAGGAVRVGDAAFTAVQAGARAWRILDASGRAELVHAVRNADGWWVHSNGAVFVIEIGGAGAPARPHREAIDADLTAPMPATVLSIVAPEGTQVRTGEVVLLLEAMKMELPIRSPRDGVVKTILCREGELVQPGVRLVEIV